MIKHLKTNIVQLLFKMDGHTTQIQNEILISLQF